MDSCSLPDLLEEIIEWCSRSEFPYGVHSWTGTQLAAVLEYISRVEVSSDFSFRMYRKLCLDEAWQRRFEPQIHRKAAAAQLVVSFLQDLGELFTVPKFQQLSHMDGMFKKNELVADFINFLLRLLQLADLDFLSRFSVIENTVMENLKFLVTILGDTPFEAAEHEQVQSITEEFEQVANQAGTLVHALIFAPDDEVSKTKNEALGVLLEHIELLKVNIIKFLDLFPNLVIPTQNGGVESSFIVGSLLHDLEDLMNREDNPLVEAKDQIRILHQWLMLCQSLLKMPQHMEIEEIEKKHMAQIIAVAYDAEYLVKSFLVGDVPLWYLTMRLPHHTNNIQLHANRFQEMNQDYDIGASRIADDDLSTQQELKAKKDSLADEIMVGFEKEEEHILDQLVHGTNRLQAIFIFGMPGIGKTTLAKKVYHHPWVSSHFDRISWCVVSQLHQRKTLLIDIVTCIRSDLKEDKITKMTEEQLELEVYKSLKDRRYLIVMDDIWDSKVWNDVWRFSPDDGNGSRILFTSRNREAAPSGCPVYVLPFLSNDQCWELLQRKVFHNNPCPLKLHEIGKKIAANCYGLPLAVVIIAGILSTVDKEESAWENVGQSLDSYMLSDHSNSMMQILELSYKHLPQHLKPCFLYFGVFKEDEKILVKTLTRLWIAEGFIRKEDKKRAERVAEEYLKELIDKSLVIVSKRRLDGGPKICFIHDLLRDLCLRIAQKENFLKLADHNCCRWNQRYYRLCIRMKSLHGSPPHCFEPRGQCTRSVFCSIPVSSLSVLNMKLLIVLDYRNMLKVNLLGIEVLVHLRYLAVKKMPSSLHNNVNLEFLIVDDNVYISSDILKTMKKLKYICGRATIFDGDCDTSQICKLDFLSIVHICNRKDLEMLKCFPDLRKLKCRNSVLCGENGPLGCLDFQFLTQLESLRVTSWSEVDEIKFPSNIRKLTLSHLCLPWERMQIIGGLPNLEVLKLEAFAFRGEKWDTRYGEFKELKILKLWRLDLVQWNVSSSEHFPKLQQLSLGYCSKLVELPCEIGDIETLQLIEVRRKCRRSLVESAIRIREEQANAGNEELEVDAQNIQ